MSGWRVERINPREVSLSGPSGTKTLQPKFDPNLTPPPIPHRRNAQSDPSTRRGSNAAGASADAAKPCAAPAGPAARAVMRICPRIIGVSVVAVLLTSLGSCQPPPEPGLTPLEQPAGLQPAAPRISGPIPANRTGERMFVDRGSG